MSRCRFVGIRTVSRRAVAVLADMISPCRLVVIVRTTRRQDNAEILPITTYLLRCSDVSRNEVIAEDPTGRTNC